MTAWRAALLSRVEDAGLNASAPPQQRWFDGWLLRLSPGKAKRARCVNALASGRLPLDEKLAQVQAVFAEAALPLVIRITPFSAPPELDDRLAALGMQTFDDTRVMVAELARARLDPDLPPGCVAEPVGPAAFAERVGAWRGSPEGQRTAHAERMRLSPVPVSAWRLLRDGQELACAQFTREGELVGLYDVFTAPEARGQGLARALCSHLLKVSAGEGARVAYLQVEGDNHPARAVYHRIGFADGYAYHYRTADPALA